MKGKKMYYLKRKKKEKAGALIYIINTLAVQFSSQSK
jgi:hypothetical protein